MVSIQTRYADTAWLQLSFAKAKFCPAKAKSLAGDICRVLRVRHPQTPSSVHMFTALIEKVRNFCFLLHVTCMNIQIRPIANKSEILTWEALYRL